MGRSTQVPGGRRGPKATREASLVLSELGGAPYHCRASVKREWRRLAATRPSTFWDAADRAAFLEFCELAVDLPRLRRQLRGLGPGEPGYSQLRMTVAGVRSELRQYAEKLRLFRSERERERERGARRAARRPVEESPDLKVVRNPWE